MTDPIRQAEHQFARGDLVAAEATCRRILQADARHARAWDVLGLIAQRFGHADSAVHCFSRAVESDPDRAEFHLHCGRALMLASRLGEAIAAYHEALRLNPRDDVTHVDLGIALSNSGQPAAAIEAWRAALSINPANAFALGNLGNALLVQGRLGESIECSTRALSLRPELSFPHNNLAIALEQQGRVDEAIAAYRRALAAAPDQPRTHSNLLMALAYHATLTPQAIYDEHRAWEVRHATPPLPDDRGVRAHANDRSRDRKLRIGYVSADFREHAVAFFLEPILAHHDGDAFEVFCYSGVTQPDDVTRRLQDYVHAWRNIVGRSDADVAEQIRADGIDILIDLAGHTMGHRLLVFARKPAPVQATYLGYPNTTGLATIDWRITDALADPAGMSDAFYTERLYRLPRCAWCFRPPPAMASSSNSASSSPLSPRPASDSVTFGSFNKHAKLSPRAMDAWAAILRAVPGSRLLIKSLSVRDEATRQRTNEQFTARGIDAAGAIDFLPWTPTLADHFAAYDRVDIALDTFPYNGTTTTCDALCRGVPVVTLAGQTHASRVGLSLLTAVGLGKLVGADVADYVRIAVALARDPGRRSALRAELPGRVTASPLGDAPGIARAMETAYRDMWHAWCEKS